MMSGKLNIGDISIDGKVEIVDEDRLCYLVRNISKGATGLRTISKQLLDEFVAFYAANPDATANDARNALSGQTEIDKFEYGYASTLMIMAKMVLDNSAETSHKHLSLLNHEEHPFQQIFYGAPGTGKSHTINKITKKEDVIRTTFHPDTDYSSFVGTYKPTMIEENVITVIGNKAVYVENNDGSKVTESKIVYEFVPQAFLLAYIAAWKNYADADVNNIKKQYLVIEEINRGNCAQIFGDLFQLLDRNDEGFSEYPINADSDMKKQLNKAFQGLEIPQKDSINAMFEGRDVVKGVLDGDLLLLPNNLYIWATMNTSDQSLFPIDSAFKRRWDWKYIPISDAGKGWMINVNGNKYDWWDFLEKINNLIGSTTNSEDKKLGYFFCKADTNNEISAETFVGKVIFYLWNDVSYPEKS
jgi:5-methylcytosine-specific restriction endonuclease McrBC GTP-binding regulatory subunit McrB